MAATSVTMTAPTSLGLTANVASGNFTVGFNGTTASTGTVTLSDNGAGGTFSTGTTLSFGIGPSPTTQPFTYTPLSSYVGLVVISATNSYGLLNPTNLIATVVDGTGHFNPVIPSAVGPNSRASVVTWLDADNFGTGGHLCGYTISAPGAGNVSPTATVAAPVGGGTTALITPVVSAGQIISFTSSNAGGSGYTVADNPITVTFSGAAGSPAAVLQIAPQDQNFLTVWPSNVGATPSLFVQTVAADLPVYSKTGGPTGFACVGMDTTEFLSCVKTDTALSPVLAAASSYSITIVFNVSKGFLGNGRFFGQINSFSNVGGQIAYNTNLKRYSDGPAITTVAQADVQNAGSNVFQGRWQVLTYTYNTGTAQETMYLNGQIAARASGAQRENWASITAYFLGDAAQWLCAQLVVDNVELSQAQVIQDALYWKNRYTTANSPLEVIAVGDSRTAGTQSTTTPALHTAFPWPVQIQQLYSSLVPGIQNFWNMGIGGSTAIQGFSASYRAAPSGANLDNFMHAFCPFYKQVAVIWYGYNSNGQGGDSTIGGYSAAWPSLFALVQAWQNLGVPVVICTETDEQNGASAWTTFRTAYNNFIINNLGEVAGQSYLARLDQNTIVGPQNASQNRSNYGADGIHMVGDNPAVAFGPSGGYTAVANTIGPKLVQALEAVLGTSLYPKPQGISRIYALTGGL